MLQNYCHLNDLLMSYICSGIQDRIHNFPPRTIQIELRVTEPKLAYEISWLMVDLNLSFSGTFCTLITTPYFSLQQSIVTHIAIAIRLFNATLALNSLMRNTGFKENNLMIPTMNQIIESIIVWGYFVALGSGTVDSELYQQILQENAEHLWNVKAVWVM